jgi:hypothetical protein
MPDTPPATSPIGPRLVAVLLFALGLNALAQVPQFLPGWGDDPPLLSLQQAAVGVAGLAAGYGAWRGRAWAWRVTALWAVLTGILIMSLPALLALPPESVNGIRAGAAVVIAIGAGCAWYLRRLSQPRTSP